MGTPGKYVASRRARAVRAKCSRAGLTTGALEGCRFAVVRCAHTCTPANLNKKFESLRMRTRLGSDNFRKLCGSSAGPNNVRQRLTT